MRPEARSQRLLGVARSKAKMHEYRVSEEHHIAMPQDPAELFILSISFLGDQAVRISRGEIDSNEQELLKNNLIFSARFFDSYLQTKLDEDLDPYLTLLGAASYYLCDLPGSASVLAKRLGDYCPDLGGEGLENLLLWLLQADLSTYFENWPGDFGELVDDISQAVLDFFEDGSGEEALTGLAQQLRSKVYDIGNPRQLLLGDIIAAILNKKVQNSCWASLPKYSGLSAEKWSSAIKKKTFIKELWPAQHLLGQKEVLKGKSAIVQMPTSAGKTKAIELILRSAFLADRAYLAVIVAPFRALCHEIKNNLTEAFRNESVKIDEFSDVLQMDVLAIDPADVPPIPDELLKALLANFDMTDFEGSKQVIVVTPEKLLYVLRHAPGLASHIGLVVFDEGHQFDSGTRGITYELLLTSLRSKLPEGTQKVLVSAVINNAEDVGQWLNHDANVVEGRNLNPTFRTVGFASWLDVLGRIEYVDAQEPSQNDFFVPRVIETLQLNKKANERAIRIFPKKTEGQEVALYLGLKLAGNGSIAIFCGKKATATKICEKAVDIFEREVTLAPPVAYSDAKEVSRLVNLHIANLGEDSAITKSAALGIFSHHANTPHGIRLAVEYAMHEDLVRIVVCTSTLAQGVNLPLRYLIVTSVHQGRESIKVRDFHNLIGRAGRAGMYTEGSVLFADPAVYDSRTNRRENRQWRLIKDLLNPENSEPCSSTLLSIFSPLENDDGRTVLKMEALDFVSAYIDEQERVLDRATDIATKLKDKKFSASSLEYQMTSKINLIHAVESFLLAHWDEIEGGLSEEDISNLAESTLAYFLADESQKSNIKKLFSVIAKSISSSVTEPNRRKVYGRTLYGLQGATAIENWVRENTESLLTAVEASEFIELIWPLLHSHITNGVFKKFDHAGAQQQAMKMWLTGEPFFAILASMRDLGAKIIWGNQRRDFTIDHIVDLCESGFAYDGALLIGSICEMIDLIEVEDGSDLVHRLHLFQKRIKYGLPTETAIVAYELGFADRVIAQELTENLELAGATKAKMIKEIRKRSGDAKEILSEYPAYFQARLDELISDFNLS